MKRICVDMDEVMADTAGEYLRRYNLAAGEQISREDLAGSNLWKILPPERLELLNEILRSEDFFADLDVIAGAREALETLSQRFEIYIATQAMVLPNSLVPKYRWLERHFPFIPPSNYIFCGDKSILLADYLIDDMPHNLRHFQGVGLLYTAPHNLLVTDFERVNNWSEVAAYFDALAADAPERQ